MSQLTQMIGMQPCGLILSRIFVLSRTAEFSMVVIKFKWITSKMKNSAPQLQCSIVTFGYELLGNADREHSHHQKNSAGHPCLEPLGLSLDLCFKLHGRLLGRFFLCEPD